MTSRDFSAAGAVGLFAALPGIPPRGSVQPRCLSPQDLLGQRAGEDGADVARALPDVDDALPGATAQRVCRDYRSAWPLAELLRSASPPVRARMSKRRAANSACSLTTASSRPRSQIASSSARCPHANAKDAAVGHAGCQGGAIDQLAEPAPHIDSVLRDNRLPRGRRRRIRRREGQRRGRRSPVARRFRCAR